MRVKPRYAIIPIHRDSETDFCSLDISQKLKDKVITKTPEGLVGGIEITIKQVS